MGHLLNELLKSVETEIIDEKELRRKKRNKRKAEKRKKSNYIKNDIQQTKKG